MANQIRNPNDEAQNHSVIRNPDLIRISGFWFRNSTVAWAVFAFILCSAVAGSFSRGFLESDGATHFIFARHALEQPIYFVDVWGRPLCTAILALPAFCGGLIGARLASMAVAVACGIAAMQIARGQGLRWPVLALIFTLGSPLVFLHSFSELTELPFALVVALAVLCYQRRAWWAMAIFTSVAPLGRPEGFFFLGLCAFALLIEKKWLPILALPIGVIAWSVAGHLMVGPADRPWWLWIADHWPYESGSEYPKGPIVYFLGILPMVVGPFALPAMWIGIWRNFAGANWRDHRGRVDFVIAGLPLAILIGHSLLFWLGKFSSSGSARYLLIVAPLWGCLCARGWEWIFTRFNWQRPASWAALAVVLPGMVNWIYPFLPLKQSASWNQAQKIVRWYEVSSRHADYPRVMANHPGIFFYLNASPWDRRRVLPWSMQDIEHPQSGVLLLWDREFCTQNSDPKLVASLQRISSAGWIEDDAATAISDANYADIPTLELKFDRQDQWVIFRSP
jgi:hypothetical protein